jgi:hypothetical protein
MNFDKAMRCKTGNLQPDGVRSDVNGSEGWHSEQCTESGERAI